MFALADCNNFYASCERLFRPEFKGVPVIVLSNNDGCVIARSDEAKAVGIAMAAPYFMIRDLIREHNVAVFSSQYTLYGDISARVMTNLARFTHDVEVYSIDECFLQFNGYADLDAHVKMVRKSVIRNTGIPISIGVAPTKTLAKVANKLSKKQNGTLVLGTEDVIAETLKIYPIEDVWGIGRQHTKKLLSIGVKTAGQFRELPMNWVQTNMTIVGVRLWQELWGNSCLPLKDVLAARKGMTTSRSFSKLIGDIKLLQEATVSYATRLAYKLRKEKLCVTVLTVKLLTNRFKVDSPQATPSISMKMPQPVNNTFDLVNQALVGLEKVYLEGYMYQKVEVTATGLVPESEVQLNIFHEGNVGKRDKLSKVVDSINRHYGTGKLKMGTEGFDNVWSMKRGFLSPNYTTDWNDIVRLK
jgi:DNA polymerase V